MVGFCIKITSLKRIALLNESEDDGSEREPAAGTKSRGREGYHQIQGDGAAVYRKGYRECEDKCNSRLLLLLLLFRPGFWVVDLERLRGRRTSQECVR